jgi:hypothetical protein
MTVKIAAFITSHLALELSLQVFFESLITFQHSGGGVVSIISHECNTQANLSIDNPTPFCLPIPILVPTLLPFIATLHP